MHREGSLDSDGIINVKGSFKKGDVVRILNQDGREIGLGVVNYASDELARKSDLLQDEIVHVVDLEAFVCHLDLSIPVC